MRFTGTPPNYWLAFMVAPVAGAMSGSILALLVVAVYSRDTSFRAVELAAIAVLAGYYSFLICAGFTLVIGAGAAAFVGARRREPSLGATVCVGIIAAALPFGTVAAIDVAGGSFRLSLEPFAMTIFAAIVSVPTAWSFWYLGLRGR